MSYVYIRIHNAFVTNFFVAGIDKRQYCCLFMSIGYPFSYIDVFLTSDDVV